MAKQSFISHAVNGYSRYDVPESKAFTCTPGILYPVRIDFINARDRVRISQGIDVRSNPLAVPSFNPYTVRLHRFWVPLQLYHPELRTNSSKFDMNNLTLNWIPAFVVNDNANKSSGTSYSNSLLSWLRVANGQIPVVESNSATATSYSNVALPSSASRLYYCNADTYLAYWDIVRNYYSYSQWGLYSIAWPASWSINLQGESVYAYAYNTRSSFFKQEYCNLEYLDAYFESQFYPSAVYSSNLTFNRSNLWRQIIASDLRSAGSVSSDGYPVASDPVTANQISANSPSDQFSTSGTTGNTWMAELSVFCNAHPFSVVPSNPDRFSRLLPTGISSAVSMTGVSTVPQLAIASRLQEYKDLLGAGGSRFSDWLETFFASKISHVDRPKLLFSASQTVNVQVIMNQAGANNFQSGETPLGQQGGSIAFNTQLGRSQSYYFEEPGYMIDMLSIRPVYYWSGIKPDYLNYEGSDYFNPIYNDIGYQDVPRFRLGYTGNEITIATEPCFNEFRSSYDEVLGQLSVFSGNTESSKTPLYSYWVQQRSALGILSQGGFVHPSLFVDMEQVNSPFASNVEDNFFVNMSYSVRKKNLVNKTFATRLSNR